MSGRRIDVPAFLQQKQQQAPAGEESWWTDFEQLYHKKLWHQLTIKLLAFVRRPEAAREDLVALYDNFIIDFETRLNPLLLMEIATQIVEQKKTPEDKLSFLTSMKEKVKTNQEASILASILICRVRLVQKDLLAVKAILEEVSPLVDAETGVTAVHGRYFQLSSEFHQLMGDHNQYYRDALRFLGCVDMESQPRDLLKNMAFALSLAALLGDNVFNFGELLQHPVVAFVQKEMPDVYNVLNAFNTGDVTLFESLKPQWSTQPDLQKAEKHLREKIRLMALMDMAFQSSTGVLDFENVARRVVLPIEEVELLVMKALSKDLVKGTINEVDKKINLTWVQPRVLDKKQIQGLRDKIDLWCKEVRTIEHLLEDRAVDIVG